MKGFPLQEREATEAAHDALDERKKKPCAWCHGTGEFGSEIVHGTGWTIAVDRKTEQCPHCKGTGKEPSGEIAS
jgi:DnaJ-class molecular chaperone